MKILVTGSSGLIGGEVVEYFGGNGHEIIGIDNNMRKEFFGEAGDTMWNLARVAHKVRNYKHNQSDIRDRHTINWIFEQQGPFDAVIHCAAQPSHDKSREIPAIDFDVNAVGTLNLLEATRVHSPEAVFIFMSTNKVYGDAPNEKLLIELPARFDYAKEGDKAGISETCRIDQSTHSIFGASKTAADILVQEYGRYFGLKTHVLRGGCLTGPGHSGVELHGFLSYLVKVAVTGKTYRIYGYKGKQVRDNIHSYDVIRAMEEIINNPRRGEVYNIGGGRENSVSILEAIAKIEKLIGKKIQTEYVDQARVGDHICYISDLAKFKSHFPGWKITKTIDQTLDEIARQDYWGVETEHKETITYPLNEHSLVFDIGGYRGAWSNSILEKYNSRMMIFEPISEFYSDCYRRFKGKDNVTVYHFGLGFHNSESTLTKLGIHTSQFLQEHGDLPKNRFSEPMCESAKIRDIVEFMDENGVQNVDLVSINCEGGEYWILRRLIDSGYINRFDNVQIQFHSFFADAENLRNVLRNDLAKTHVESFNYPFVWESWKRR